MLLLLSSVRDGNGSKYEIRTCRWLMLLGRYAIDFTISHEGLVQIILGDRLDFSSAWLDVGIWGTLSWQRLSLLSSPRQVVWQLMPGKGLKSVYVWVSICVLDHVWSMCASVSLCVCACERESRRVINWQANVFECDCASMTPPPPENRFSLSRLTIGKG